MLGYVQVTGKYVVGLAFQIKHPVPWQCTGSHLKYDLNVCTTVPQFFAKWVQLLHLITRNVTENSIGQPTIYFPVTCTLGHFIFRLTQLFKVFGAYPVPWDVDNKTVSFFSDKNCFFGSRTRDKILKILWEVKK